MSQNFPQNFTFSPGFKQEFPNPDNFRNIHKDFQKIAPIWFEGMNLSLRQNYGINKALFLNWNIGNVIPSGFRIRGQCCEKIDEYKTKTPLIIADTNPLTLATSLKFLVHPLNNWRVTGDIRTPPFPFYNAKGKFLTSVDFMQNDCTICVGLEDPCSKRNGKFSLGFLKSFTNNFIGGVNFSVKTAGIDLNPELTFASRYFEGNGSVAATISNKSFDLSYWQWLFDDFQFAAKMSADFETKTVIGEICYQCTIDETVIRTSVDSAYRMGFTYYRLPYGGFGFGISFLYSIPSNKCLLGLKLDFDPNL